MYKGEDLEQFNVVQWLEANKYKFTAIPNSTFTRSWNQKRRNKDLGVRPGMSDLIIILKRGNVLFLEMKKARGVKGGMSGSKISEYQLQWQKAINKCSGSQYEIAHGSEEAINLIKTLENGQSKCNV